MNLLFGCRIPLLPKAACAGQWVVYDEALEGDSYAEQTALSICEFCPELAACREWFDSLPTRQKPFGVIAGRVRRPRKKWAA